MPAAEEETEEVISERKWVMQYLDSNKIEDSLNDVLNVVVQSQPLDPFVVMSDLLKAKSEKQNGILNVLAREILDSKGTPTIEVEISTHKGVFRSSFPCKLVGNGPKDIGYSVEMRDGQTLEEKEANFRRYSGKGLTEIVKMVNDVLGPQLMQFLPTDQKGVDDFLKKKTPKPKKAPLKPDEEKAEADRKKKGGKEYEQKMLEKLQKDEQERKEAIPHCAALPISMAVCKAGAAHSDMPLWEYVAKLSGRSMEETCIPVPVMSLIDGGLHASTKNFIQELMIVPYGAPSFAEAVRMGVEVQQKLRQRFEKELPEALHSGDLGGFVPNKDAEDVLQFVVDAIEQTEHKDKVKIALDMAASNFKIPAEEGEVEREIPDSVKDYDLGRFDRNDGVIERDSDDVLEMYRKWLDKHPLICSIEDPFDRYDWDFFFKFVKTIHEDEEEGEHEKDEDAYGKEGDEEVEAAKAAPKEALGGDENCQLQVVGDELLSSRIDSSRAIKDKNVNTVLLDISKRATVTEHIVLAKNAQEHGCAVIVGARSGETEDSFISEFAVGICAGQIKGGAPTHAEHTAKYNQLLRISSMAAAPPYAGAKFRSLGMREKQHEEHHAEANPSPASTTRSSAR